MNKLKLTIGLIIVLLLTLVFTACSGEAIGVKGVTVDDNGNVIVEYADGSTQAFGTVAIPEPEKPVTIKNQYVNEEKHLIVEFSDGTSKDLGYVGVEVQVEVEPPLYKVTFYDLNGNKLSEQEVYKGKSAKAPTAPEIKDMVFTGWDKDFSNVTENLEIRPQYTGAATYTVTFKDEKGNVLSTQTVITGYGATAPTPPTREDTIFDGWDKKFDKITSDLTVTAKYRAKKTFTVTFADYSGLVLKTETVKETGSATAPSTPTREGYTFTGWSSGLDNITSNKTLTAQYKLNSGNNIVDIAYKLGANNTVTLTYTVKGTVKFCGMEGEVVIPSGFTFKSLTQGDGATANHKDGKVYFMFASNNGQNVTKETTLFTLTFSYTDAVNAADFTTNVSDMYDQNYTKVEFKVIGDTVKVK